VSRIFGAVETTALFRLDRQNRTKRLPAGILEWQYKEGILIRSSAGDPAKTQERILPLGGTLLNGAPNMLSSSQSSLLRETRECHGARSPFLPSTREPARKNRTINI